MAKFARKNSMPLGIDTNTPKDISAVASTDTGWLNKILYKIKTWCNNTFAAKSHQHSNVSELPGIITTSSVDAVTKQLDGTNIDKNANVPTTDTGGVLFNNIRKIKIGTVTICTFDMRFKGRDGWHTCSLPVAFSKIYTIQVQQTGGGDGDSSKVHRVNGNKIMFHEYSDGRSTFSVLIIGEE